MTDRLPPDALTELDDLIADRLPPDALTWPEEIEELQADEDTNP
jgi:hypothetical protein